MPMRFIHVHNRNRLNDDDIGYSSSLTNEHTGKGDVIGVGLFGRFSVELDTMSIRFLFGGPHQTVFVVGGCVNGVHF